MKGFPFSYALCSVCVILSWLLPFQGATIIPYWAGFPFHAQFANLLVCFAMVITSAGGAIIVYHILWIVSFAISRRARRAYVKWSILKNIKKDAVDKVGAAELELMIDAKVETISLRDVFM